MKNVTTIVFSVVLLLMASCGGGGGSSSATDADGGGSSSTTDAGGSPPSSPANVVVVAGDSQATISWDSSSSDSGIKYNLYMSNDDSGITKDNYSTKNGGEKISDIQSPYVIKLSNGNTYHFVVTAENEFGESDVSEEVTAKPDSVESKK